MARPGGSRLRRFPERPPHLQSGEPGRHPGTWNQGGLVTLSAHLYNPANPKGGGLRDQGVDLETLLAPNGDTHTRWMQELDLTFIKLWRQMFD